MRETNGIGTRGALGGMIGNGGICFRGATPIVSDGFAFVENVATESDVLIVEFAHWTSINMIISHGGV